MRGKSINRATAGIGVLIVASALSLSAATPAQADSLERGSISCSSPSENKANYSWDAGIHTMGLTDITKGC